MKKLILVVGILSAAAVSVSAADGKANFATLCAKCHGADGKGDTKMGQRLGIKDLTDAKVQAAFKDADAFKALKEGMTRDDKTLMKPVEGLSDAELNDLVAYVRTLKQ